MQFQCERFDRDNEEHEPGRSFGRDPNALSQGQKETAGRLVESNPKKQIVRYGVVWGWLAGVIEIVPLRAMRSCRKHSNNRLSTHDPRERACRTLLYVKL